MPSEFLQNGRFPKKSYYKPTGRPRGRPRGSKSNPERHLAAEAKVKRPVGRPRKFADDHPRYLPKGSRPRGRPRGSALGPRSGNASRRLPPVVDLDEEQERDSVESDESDPLEVLSAELETKVQNEERINHLADYGSQQPTKRKGRGRPRKYPDDHPKYLPKGSRPRGRPGRPRGSKNRITNDLDSVAGSTTMRSRGRGRPRGRGRGRGRGRPPGRSRAPEVEILIQGEPETLEVTGGSYFFGGRNSDYDHPDDDDDVDVVDDCAVVNEYIEESQEEDVDTIVIGQGEEGNGEEADYEDDIEIHEESLED